MPSCRFRRGRGVENKTLVSFRIRSAFEALPKPPGGEAANVVAGRVEARLVLSVLRSIATGIGGAP